MSNKNIHAFFAFLSAMVLASTVHAASFRFSYLGTPGSEQDMFVRNLSMQVKKATDGRVAIKRYPAKKLGDWTEVQEFVMQGAIDFALQPMSIKLNKSVALPLFPYAVTDYKTAEKAFLNGGYIKEAIRKSSKKLGLSVLDVFANGMGGAGFVTTVNEPANTEAIRDVKVRIWPGGATHQFLLERLGFQPVTILWDDIYSSLKQGIVEGAIGGTATDQVDFLLDATKMWIQYNDHFEVNWIFANTASFDRISEKDKKTFKRILNQLAKERFAKVKSADKKSLEALRKAGVKVVEFTPQEMKKLVTVVRRDVWPQIAKELDRKTYDLLLEKTGSQ